MLQQLLGPAEVAERIQRGKHLLLAGDEALLRRLPAGNWIAGTSPYFMGQDGGVFSPELVFCTELPPYCTVRDVRVYERETLPTVYRDAPAHGFSLIILPCMSPIHFAFATDAPAYPEFARRPLVGWLSGVAVAEIGHATPKVIDGRSLTVHSDAAMVMHVDLAPEKLADLRIVNMFALGHGPAIRFPQTGFQVTDALVDGRRVNFAEYLAAAKVDTRLPLVADYEGAHLNTGFQVVDLEHKKVSFYAPVFEGHEYYSAQPVQDYVKEFSSRIELPRGDVIFSCNCILNFLYSNLEGRKTGPFVGPITFGEIAYQLVNQTLVYLEILDA